MRPRELPSWTLPVSWACLVVWAVAMALALAGCSAEAPEPTWPESTELSELESGQDRFSTHDTNLAYWEVVVDHRTGVQYLYRYKYGLCPLLDADGSPLLVAEAGQ